MTEGLTTQLNHRLRSAGLEPLDQSTVARFEIYLSLFLRWNQRLNLSAVRDEVAVIDRHLVESIQVARNLPAEIRTLLDFGSGGGLPGIPIALCRPGIAVTLAESKNKKAAFLQEAVRALGLTATVHAGRAETLRSTFDCVTLRAVDKMPEAVAAAVPRVSPAGWLALMITHSSLLDLQATAGSAFSWLPPIPLPGSESRILVLGKRINAT